MRVVEAVRADPAPHRRTETLIGGSHRRMRLTEFMLTPVVMWRRVVDRLRDRLHEKDPEYDALRRATRAGIVLPISAALGFSVRARKPRCSAFSARSRC